MLDDIHDQHEVKQLLIIGRVYELKGESIGCSVSSHLKGCLCDLIAHKASSCGHLVMKLMQDLTCTTADLANCLD